MGRIILASPNPICPTWAFIVLLATRGAAPASAAAHLALGLSTFITDDACG